MARVMFMCANVYGVALCCNTVVL